MKRETALKILKDVRQSYDLIAEEFSATRKMPWKEFESLVEYVKERDKVLDLGCGNGRLVEFFAGKKIDYSGIDISEKLIEIARDKYPNYDFRVFDGLKIPFEDDYFDAVFCIAVLHHIPGSELREEFLRETKRVLKPGGKLILSVWYLWQKGTSWKLFFKFTFLKLIGKPFGFAQGKSELDFFDTMVPWGRPARTTVQSGGISERYFHSFRKNELKILINKINFKIEKFSILKREPKNKNLLVIAIK